jgi:hypothetical protein
VKKSPARSTTTAIGKRHSLSATGCGLGSVVLVPGT